MNQVAMAPPFVLMERLTPRENQVMQLIARGMTNREIATCLTITEATVRTFTYLVREKLGCRTRTQLVVMAHRMGLVTFEAVPPPPDPPKVSCVAEAILKLLEAKPGALVELIEAGYVTGEGRMR